MTKNKPVSSVEMKLSLPQKLKKTAKELEFSISISGKNKKEVRRPPLNLGIVIDQSGSMSSSIDGNHYVHAQPVYIQPVIQPWIQPQPYPNPNIPNEPWLTPTIVCNHANQGNGHISGGVVDNNIAKQAAAAVLQLQHQEVKLPTSKLEMVVKAVKIAVEQLLPDDLVSLIIFDDKAQVLLAPTPASQKEKIFAILNSIKTDGSTDLFNGWKTGGGEVVKNLDTKKMNRILLFTDGQANYGITNPDIICERVKKLAETGISTSTFGVGRDYNEDLLQKMALAGDGNYYYISKTDECIDMFQTEFKDMQNLVAGQVYLKVDGVEVTEQLNDWDLINGKYKLPNLLIQKPIQGMFVAKLPKDWQKKSFELTLSGIIDGQEFTQKDTFSMANLLKENASQEAEDLKSQLLVAREKKKAIQALDMGRVNEAKDILRSASVMYCASANMMGESANLMNLAANSDTVSMRKSALFQSYSTQYSRDSDVKDADVKVEETKT